MRQDKIYYNLDESTYKFDVGDFTLYFSSIFYLNKYKDIYADYLVDENYKANVRYKCNINLTNVLLITLYKTIEKRGFRVYFKGTLIKNDIEYSSIINIE